MLSLVIQCGQSDPTAEFVKTGIGAKAVQSCVRRKVLHKNVRAFFVGTIEPGECFVLFSQACIDYSDVLRSDIAVLGHLFHMV